jgi:hypothetical protein
MADFNRDGKLDVVTANYDSNDVSLLRGDGAGAFAAPLNFPAGTQPNALAVSDFNGDGKLDLAVANSGSGDISILLGDGAGSFAAPISLPMGPRPWTIAAADFSGDGTVDLAVGDTFARTVSILVGNGSGEFVTAATYSLGTLNHVAASDFNGDGRPDLVVTNEPGTVAILLNTTATAPRVSIGNASAVEGSAGTTNAVFTVNLFAANGQTTTVHYASADGTATAGSDYIATAGVLTFPPGSTSQTISVTINGDSVYEPDETFFVDLSAPTNAIIGDGQGTGTIVNDDPLPSLSISDVSVAEGNTGTTSAVFTVTLTGPTSQTATVSFQTADGTATAGSDYGIVIGTLTSRRGRRRRRSPSRSSGTGSSRGTRRSS